MSSSLLTTNDLLRNHQKLAQIIPKNIPDCTARLNSIFFPLNRNPMNSV
jgi:hypothetical protein